MRKLPLAAAFTALALPAMADDAALLMGVDRYNDLRRVSDGRDILNGAEALGDAGYEVTTLSDGSIRDMRRALSQLADRALDAERLVVGLSGRFATDGGRTWFLADDADTPTPFGLDDAISVETVMDVLSRTPGQAVLVLGYEQGNFASYGPYLREGVGQLDVPQGVTVIYGEPSRVDDVLTRAVAEPGVDVMAWLSDNNRLNVLGYQPQSLIMQPAPSRSPEPARPLPQIDPSLAAWNDAQEANTADSYRNFIFDYPRSPYVSEARRRLNEIESDPVRLAEIAENALNLTRTERRAIQQNLTLLDFDTRGVDGIFGPGSRGAIRNWQQLNGYTQTSFLTREQINRLDAQASRRRAEIAAEEERAREEALRLDRDYWEETGARGTQAGYRAYLDRYPQGIYAEQARAALQEEEQQNNQAEAQAQEDALNVNPVLRRLIEGRLASLGYNPGTVDGVFDRDTRGALSRYQQRNNLPATGYLNQPTLARLLADTIGR